MGNNDPYEIIFPLFLFALGIVIRLSVVALHANMLNREQELGL
jgi:hypothetical protein